MPDQLFSLRSGRNAVKWLDMGCIFCTELTLIIENIDSYQVYSCGKNVKKIKQFNKKKSILMNATIF